MSYVNLRTAKKLTGLHPHTLRKYADNGTIPSYRQTNGNRMFDVSGLINQKHSTICYARVSTNKQKEDLERQAYYLQERFPHGEIIKDIGSGLNFKRKGFLSILERCLSGESIEVVVTYRDRIARFGFPLIEWLITRSKGKIVVLNQVDTSPTTELVHDLIAIITVFSSRMHGLRSYSKKIKANLIETNQETTTEIETVDGNL